MRERVTYVFGTSLYFLIFPWHFSFQFRGAVCARVTYIDNVEVAGSNPVGRLRDDRSSMVRALTLP
mgnify:CR=1 FL=1